MKKIMTLIIITSLIGIIIGPRIDAMESNSIRKDRLETIKEKGVLTVVGPPEENPFFQINPETNEISGIDADIINEVARRLGVNKIDIKEEAFANLLEKFNTDESIDVAIGGIFISPEREKLVAFTKPLYKESEVVIVPRFSKINFMSDLKNAVVGVERGTIFEDLTKKLKEDKLIKDVITVESITELFNAMKSGKIDAALADSIIISHQLSKEKAPSLRTLIDYTPKLQGVIGMAVKKGDTSLLNAINKIINDMKADGTLEAILRQNGLDKNSIITN